MWICAYNVRAFGDQKRVPGPLELELQMVVRLTGVLGIKLKSAADQYELLIPETLLQAQEKILCINFRERTDISEICYNTNEQLKYSNINTNKNTIQE